MKTIKTVTGILTALVISTTCAFAVDYSQYSTEELAAMRSQMRNATQEERDAFRKEWQSRMQNMDPSERSTYQMGRGKGSGSGTCQGSGSGQGRGQGKGHRYGRR